MTAWPPYAAGRIGCRIACGLSVTPRPSGLAHVLRESCVTRAGRRRLVRRAPRDLVAGAASRFVRFFRADHDDRLVVERRHAVDDALRTRRGLAAHDADGLELVDAFGE